MQISRKQAREELDFSKNPLFLFDDDCDGLCSYLIMWRYKKEGKGIIVKGRPLVDAKYISKIEENRPDKIFILDIAIVEQEFLDGAKELGADVIWIDHHPILERDHVKHYNPRYKNESRPTSQLCHEIVDQDMWLAVTGTVSDWMYTDMVEQFSRDNPQLIGEGISTPESALFETRIGLLARIFSFNMKGKLSDVMKAIKVLTRVESPEEILEQKSDAARFIYRRYEHVNHKYAKLLGTIIQTKPRGVILLYTYSDDEWSLTKDLSNEALHRFPDKVVMIGRVKDGEVKLSIRAKNYILQPLLEMALVGIEGYGGGHEHACGANVKEHDFDRFVEQFKEQIEKSKNKNE